MSKKVVLGQVLPGAGGLCVVYGGVKVNSHKESLKSGIPNPRILIPDDLRWNWCNNNKNKGHNKCNALESSWNLPPLRPIHDKIIFYETGPWCQKCGELLSYATFIKTVFVLAALGLDMYFKKHIRQAARISTPYKNYQDRNPTGK